MDPIRVLLVDDHALFRRGVADVLAGQSRLKVVAEASDGIEAIQQAQTTSPDVVLMDLMMPRCGGLEATASLHTLLPQLNILILSVSDKEADLFAAMNIGAKGYLLKNAEPEEIVQAILHVAKGGVIVSAPMAEKLITEFKEGARKGPPTEEGTGHLSKREDEVLQLVAQGASNREIAHSLFISENTVKTHLRVIMDKLHLANRSQAAAYAVKVSTTRH